MTTPTDLFASIARRTQDATTTAVRTWTETLQNYTTSFNPENPLPKAGDVNAVVDSWFDLVTRLLDEQRTLTKSLVEAGSEAAGTLTEQARTAAAQVTEQARTAASQVTDTVNGVVTEATEATESTGSTESPKRARAARGNS